MKDLHRFRTGPSGPITLAEIPQLNAGWRAERRTPRLRCERDTGVLNHVEIDDLALGKAEAATCTSGCLGITVTDCVNELGKRSRVAISCHPSCDSRDRHQRLTTLHNGFKKPQGETQNLCCIDVA